MNGVVNIFMFIFVTLEPDKPLCNAQIVGSSLFIPPSFYAPFL